MKKVEEIPSKEEITEEGCGLGSKNEDEDEELSEGEVQEPPKRIKDSRDPKNETFSPQQQPKKQTPVQAKEDRICNLWRKGKCPRGKKCHHLHSKRKPTASKEVSQTTKSLTSTDIAKEEEKPKSLYAAVCPKRCAWLMGSCCRVKWRGRILCYCRFWCILGSMGYWSLKSREIR